MLFPDKVGDFETSPNAGPCHVIVGKAPWALRILSTTSQLNVQRKTRQWRSRLSKVEENMFSLMLLNLPASVSLEKHHVIQEWTNFAW
jgi:hypothetical protein